MIINNLWHIRVIVNDLYRRDAAGPALALIPAVAALRWTEKAAAVIMQAPLGRGEIHRVSIPQLPVPDVGGSFAWPGRQPRPRSGLDGLTRRPPR
jgi:hypothetical protein